MDTTPSQSGATDSEVRLREPKMGATYAYYDEDGKEIAHLRVYEAGMEIWLTDLWVKPSIRRQGHARKMLEAAIRDWGRRDMFLQVIPYADRPLDEGQLSEIYASVGFVEVIGSVMRRQRDV